MSFFQIVLFTFLVNISYGENIPDSERRRRSDDDYKSCVGFQFRSLKEIATDIDERRADRDNHFFGQYVRSVNFIINQQNEQLIYASRGPTAMVIIFIIFAFVLLILLILALADVIPVKGRKFC